MDMWPKPIRVFLTCTSARFTGCGAFWQDCVSLRMVCRKKFFHLLARTDATHLFCPAALTGCDMTLFACAGTCWSALPLDLASRCQLLSTTWTTTFAPKLPCLLLMPCCWTAASPQCIPHRSLLYQLLLPAPAMPRATTINKLVGVFSLSLLFPCTCVSWVRGKNSLIRKTVWFGFDGHFKNDPLCCIPPIYVSTCHWLWKLWWILCPFKNCTGDRGTSSFSFLVVHTISCWLPLSLIGNPRICLFFFSCHWLPGPARTLAYCHCALLLGLLPQLGFTCCICFSCHFCCHSLTPATPTLCSARLLPLRAFTMAIAVTQLYSCESENLCSDLFLRIYRPRGCHRFELLGIFFSFHFCFIRWSLTLATPTF